MLLSPPARPSVSGATRDVGHAARSSVAALVASRGGRIVGGRPVAEQVLQPAAARLETDEREVEVDDRVADEVVRAVRQRDEDLAPIDANVRARRTERVREPIGALVDLDRERPVCCVNVPRGAARRSRPASIATRKSQTRSISPSRWLAMTIAMPKSVPVRRTRSSISSRPAGSSPFVGSSRRSRRGSWTSAWASFTRCFMPVE